MFYLCTKIRQMKRLTILFCTFIMTLVAHCAVTAEADSSFLLKSYLKALETLARERDSLNTTTTAYPTPNAYYFQILSHPTLYSSPLHQMMSQTDLWTPATWVRRPSISLKPTMWPRPVATTGRNMSVWPTAFATL